MELTPCIGIGDLLILKMVCLSDGLEIKQINLSTKLLNIYRQYPERFYQFLQSFIKCLFPTTIVAKTDNNFIAFPLNKYKIKTPYIYDHLSFVEPKVQPKRTIKKPYIVFHTKVRLERYPDRFAKNDLPKLEVFLKTFHPKKTIVLMGERVIEECYEQRVLGIISLYNVLKKLEASASVIDLTKEVLYSGNPDYNDFLHDLEVIHHADLNITFGIGGPLNICQAVSQKNLAFVGFVSDYRWIIGQYHGIHYDIESFLHALELN
jgi:hypothetical protein